MNISQDGYSSFLDVDVDNTIQTIKSTYGKVFYIEAENINAADAWLQFWDVATPLRGAVSAVATHTDGSKYTSNGHGLSAGDVLIHEAFADTAYLGEVTILTVVDVNNYTTAATYTATGTGTFILKPKLSIGVAAGNGTLYGSKVIAAVGEGINFETNIKYSASTTVGAYTDPTVGLVLNVLYQ